MKVTSRLFKFALLGAAAPFLTGCVAAVVPLAAGGAILGRGDKRDTVEERVVDPGQTTEVPGAIPDPSPEPDPIVTVEPAEETGAAASDGFIVEPSAEPAAPEPQAQAPEDARAGKQQELPPAEGVGPDFIGPPAEDIAPPPAAQAVPQVEQASAPQQAATETDKPQPAPPASAGAESPEPKAAADPAPTAVDFRAYDVFYGYVEQQARRNPVGNPRQSALLASPGSLSPRRTDCSIRPPAVLIDLDPAGGAVGLDETQKPDPALTQILLSLRLQEIEIFWISQRPAIDAGAIRRILVASGLDPRGRDRLLLMRREDDRKQTRRQELGETHCLLAIAGDDRADFDELYLYLKDTSAAQPLEELIGAGWFITPLPLTEGR